MAFETHYRKTYIEYIREIIGDKDGILFDTDELLSYVDKWSDRYYSTATVRAENNKFYLSCCNTGHGVRDLVVSSGLADAVYLIDEPAGLVIFDVDDPENSAAAITDGDTIDVSYYCVCTPKLASELFFILSSNHTKLVASQSIVGVSMDLKELADAFYAQAVRWEIES